MSTLTRLATAVLDAAGESALAGDLLEERRSGRSAVWYARQVMTALWHVTVRNARTHAFHTFCAVAIGWIVLQVTDGQLPFSAHPEVNAWMTHTHLEWPFAAMRYLAAGWVVSRMFAARGQRFVMVACVTLFFMLRAAIESGLILWFSLRLAPGVLLVSRTDLVVSMMMAMALPVVTLTAGLVGRPSPDPA
jgi:hypothetical protein